MVQYELKVSGIMEMFEKTKVYKMTPEVMQKVKEDIKSDRMDRCVKILVYGTIAGLLAVGVIGKQLIITYAVGNITSKTVKYLMR